MPGYQVQKTLDVTSCASTRVAYLLRAHIYVSVGLHLLFAHSHPCACSAQLGMTVMVREGSAARNLRELVALLRDPAVTCMMCSGLSWGRPAHAQLSRGTSGTRPQSIFSLRAVLVRGTHCRQEGGHTKNRETILPTRTYTLFKFFL